MGLLLALLLSTSVANDATEDQTAAKQVDEESRSSSGIEFDWAGPSAVAAAALSVYGLSSAIAVLLMGGALFSAGLAASPGPGGELARMIGNSSTMAFVLALATPPVGALAASVVVLAVARSFDTWFPAIGAPLGMIAGGLASTLAGVLVVFGCVGIISLASANFSGRTVPLGPEDAVAVPLAASLAQTALVATLPVWAVFGAGPGAATGLVLGRLLDGAPPDLHAE